MSLSKNKIVSFLLATLFTCLMVVNPLSLIGAAEAPPDTPDTPGGSADKPTGAPTEELGKEFKFFEKYLFPSGNRVDQSPYRNPAELINVLIVRFMFIVGGVVFFFLVLFSGFRIAFANDKKKVLADTRQYLTTGVIGLLIMFAAYWIVEIIGKLTKIDMPL